MCFEAGLVPIEWRSACFVPLYKSRGDKYECSNSEEAIRMLCVVGKYGRCNGQREVWL